MREIDSVPRGISRRALLGGGAVVGGSLLLAACKSASPSPSGSAPDNPSPVAGAAGTEPPTTLAFQGVISSVISYNTSMVGASQFTSHKDLLNPRWKGQIIAADPRGGAAATSRRSFCIDTRSSGPIS